MNNKEIIKKLNRIISDATSLKKELQKTEAVTLFDELEVKQKYSEEKDNAIKVLNHLSDMRIKYKLAERRMSPSPQRIKVIMERISESSIQDAKDVIDTRFHEWYGSAKMEQYLRYETLFNKTKYHTYVDEIDRIKGLMVKKQPEGQGFWAS